MVSEIRFSGLNQGNPTKEIMSFYGFHTLLIEIRGQILNKRHLLFFLSNTISALEFLIFSSLLMQLLR